MRTYEALLDVSTTWEEDEIGVMTFLVQAPDALTAQEVAIREMEEGKYEEELNGREWYLWDITEMDQVPTYIH